MFGSNPPGQVLHLDSLQSINHCNPSQMSGLPTLQPPAQHVLFAVLHFPPLFIVNAAQNVSRNAQVETKVEPAHRFFQFCEQLQ